MPSPDWAAIVFQPQWLSRLDRLALKRFTQAGLSEEASSYVIEKLSDNQWQACQQFSGQAKPETYLLTLTQNLLEEFSRKRFGRPRPPEWLKREGDLWVRLWKMICLERQSITAVIDKLNYAGERDSHYLQQAIKTIKGRLPWCGSSAREIPADCLCHSEDDPQPELIGADIEGQLDNNEWEEALQLLFEWLLSDNCPSNDIGDVLNDSLDQLRSRLALEPQERLMLKMVYQEGLKLNIVAKAFNMPSYQPGRLLKSIHQRIQTALSEANINLSSLDFNG